MEKHERRMQAIHRLLLRNSTQKEKQKFELNKSGRVVYPRCFPINKLGTSGGKPPFPTADFEFHVSYLLAFCTSRNAPEQMQSVESDQFSCFFLPAVLLP